MAIAAIFKMIACSAHHDLVIICTFSLSRLFCVRARRNNYRFDIKQMNAECEANYIRLTRLLPAIAGELEEVRAGTLNDICLDELCRELIVDMPEQGAIQLKIEIVELCRYTTRLRLQTKPLFENQSSAIVQAVLNAALEMEVRMYHDVRMAEVIEFSGHQAIRASYAYPNTTMFQPDEKTQQNHFLSEVLSLVLQRGRVVDSAAEKLRLLGKTVAKVAHNELN